MKLLAHLTEISGILEEQSLKDHCYHTAEYASKSIGSANLHHVVYLAGLLHDAGKAKKEYMVYLEDAFCGKPVIRGSVNHTFAGCIFLLEKYHLEMSSTWEKLTCEIISYAVGAHHGMFDCVDLDGKNGFLHRLRKDRQELCYSEAIHNYLAQVAGMEVIEGHFQKAVHEVKEFFISAKNTYARSGGKVFFQISMMIRLALSAVIYGDRRDTSEFIYQLSQDKGEIPVCDLHMDIRGQKDCGTEKKDSFWKKQLDYFEQKISAFDSSTMLNRVRKDISKQCLDAADRRCGIYRLNVPTGGGKTLCTLRFALAHAEKYHKKRIIFIIPLLSILDQNVKVIREYVLHEEDVLEHHSNVIHRRTDEHAQAADEELDRYEFFAESWNAPIVVSTLVQLLNILFSHQMSAVGRMQALCDSVIVIDEVQSLPKKMTIMFNMAMNFLQQYCNASIVLSSATQPCFEELNWPLHLADQPDMVCLNSEQLKVFQRADIIDCTSRFGMDWEECVAFCLELMQKHASLLVVCNTKAEARILFEKLKGRDELGEWDFFHLSTSMCQEHRLEKLDQLKQSLDNLQQALHEKTNFRKLVCVSTQLIEAGVDLSFKCVVRVLAGIDNLAQAAGRCNRSNEYGKPGKVYLIKLKNENLNMLKEIKSAQLCTRKVLDNRDDGSGTLIDDLSARQFYKYLFEETKNEIRYPCPSEDNKIKNQFYLADLLSNGNQQEDDTYILHQPFKTIGEIFKVFDQNTIDVLTAYGEGKEFIEQLEKMQQERFDLVKYKKIIQQAQKYTVSIYDWQKEKLDQAGLLYSVLDGRVFVLDQKAYNSSYGLVV